VSRSFVLVVFSVIVLLAPAHAAPIVDDCKAKCKEVRERLSKAV
jgi:hypothetical protein